MAPTKADLKRGMAPMTMGLLAVAGFMRRLPISSICLTGSTNT